MKHAIVIMAHKEYDHLKRLINYFNKDCFVFVHIDKQSSMTIDEIANIATLPNVVRVFRKYSIHWGGNSMLDCELFLFTEIIKVCNFDYYHLISGQDYPIKPLSYFLDFFEKNRGVNFVSCVHLPNQKWQNNTYSRFEYFYLFDWANKKKRISNWVLNFVDWQKKIGIKRNIPNVFEHLYGGSQWFSITYESVCLINSYTRNNKKFYRRLKYTFAPEECYIQTILRNFLPKEKLLPYNYRYIRWRFENNNSPSNLSREHFHFLVSTKDLFARKFEHPYSFSILPKIDEFLISETDCEIMQNGGWVYKGYLKYKFDDVFYNKILRYCKWMNFKTLLDAGCGAGIMVAAFRRNGIAATGIDANPYTPLLSSHLLPYNDKPCDCLDLTEDFTCDGVFDVVICIDVLDLIPNELQSKVVENLVKLAEKSIVISFSNTNRSIAVDVERNIIRYSKNKFRKNIGLSLYMSEYTSVQNVLVFESINLN